MRKLSAAFALIIAVMSIISVAPPPAFAASNGVGVNPRKDYVVNPGQSIHDTITVRNLDTKQSLVASVTLLDFQAAGQTGSPQLLLTRKEPTRWSLKPYLTIQTSLNIPPSGSVDVPVTISMPKTIGGGSYYSAIRFSSNGGGSGGNVGMTGSASTLAFVRVPGKTTDNLNLLKFGAFVPTADFTGGSYKTYFGSAKPKLLSFTVKNTGNVADEPTGSVQINNMFGKQFTIVKNINPNHNLVLIDQTRRIDVCIIAPSGSNTSTGPDSVMDITKCPDPSLWPGRYTVKLDLLYGNNGSPSNEIRTTTAFWYIPAWFIIAVIALLALIVGFIWMTVHAIHVGRSRRYRGR